MSIQRFFCFFGTLLLIANSPLSADLVVLDDDFASGDDYSIFDFNGDNPDDDSFAEFEINLSGGNPDDALSLMHIHDVERDGAGAPINGNGETRVFSALRNTDVSYNPFFDGGFDTVTYSFQYNTNDADLDFVFAHMRNASNGMGSFAGLETAVVADGNWQTFSQTFTDDDFSNIDFSGATSASLRFGFGFESNRDVTNDLGEVMMNVQVDNFTVTLASSVPEPGSLWIVGLVGLAIMGRRRKR